VTLSSSLTYTHWFKNCCILVCRLKWIFLLKIGSTHGKLCFCVKKIHNHTDDNVHSHCFYMAKICRGDTDTSKYFLYEDQLRFKKFRLIQNVLKLCTMHHKYYFHLMAIKRIFMVLYMQKNERSIKLVLLDHSRFKRQLGRLGVGFF
jgi:hypothetical protein